MVFRMIQSTLTNRRRKRQDILTTNTLTYTNNTLTCTNSTTSKLTQHETCGIRRNSRPQWDRIVYPFGIEKRRCTRRKSSHYWDRIGGPLIRDRKANKPKKNSHERLGPDCVAIRNRKAKVHGPRDLYLCDRRDLYCDTVQQTFNDLDVDRKSKNRYSMEMNSEDSIQMINELELVTIQTGLVGQPTDHSNQKNSSLGKNSGVRVFDINGRRIPRRL